jgi:hypothetical protein
MLDYYKSLLDLSFLDCFNLIGLQQWVREGTFVPFGNVLDLVLISETDKVSDVSMLPQILKCHHCPIVCEYYL